MVVGVGQSRYEKKLNDGDDVDCEIVLGDCGIGDICPHISVDCAYDDDGDYAIALSAYATPEVISDLAKELISERLKGASNE